MGAPSRNYSRYACFVVFACMRWVVCLYALSGLSVCVGCSVVWSGLSALGVVLYEVGCLYVLGVVLYAWFVCMSWVWCCMRYSADLCVKGEDTDKPVTSALGSAVRNYLPASARVVNYRKVAVVMNNKTLTLSRSAASLWCISLPLCCFSLMSLCRSSHSLLLTLGKQHIRLNIFATILIPFRGQYVFVNSHWPVWPFCVNRMAVLSSVICGSSLFWTMSKTQESYTGQVEK